MTVNRFRLVGFLVLAATVLFTIPVFAQLDFSGEWAPRFYEDQPERVPGPELGDYLGQINEVSESERDLNARLGTIISAQPAGQR